MLKAVVRMRGIFLTATRSCTRAGANKAYITRTRAGANRAYIIRDN